MRRGGRARGLTKFDLSAFVDPRYSPPRHALIVAEYFRSEVEAGAAATGARIMILLGPMVGLLRVGGDDVTKMPGHIK